MTLGTAIGDPTEANWVGESFLKNDNKELYIGSVKGNIGYVVEITLINCPHSPPT
jgi:acyl transferase domain-containing protein